MRPLYLPTMNFFNNEIQFNNNNNNNVICC